MSQVREEQQLVPFWFQLYPSQKEALEELAEKLGRSQAQLIREAVTSFIVLHKSDL